MADDQNAGPTPSAPQAPNDPPENGTVALALVGPFYMTTYSVETKSGDTLVFDRNGTVVAAGDVDQIITDAAALGVILNRK